MRILRTEPVASKFEPILRQEQEKLKEHKYQSAPQPTILPQLEPQPGVFYIPKPNEAYQERKPTSTFLIIV